MTIRDPFVHSASVKVAVPAQQAFEFMADGMQQARWALGSWNRKHVEGDIFVGASLFDGKDLYVRLVGHPELLLVDYHIGPSPTELIHLVEARVMPGAPLGLGASNSIVTLTTWRGPDDDDEAWELTYHLWRTEVHLIKGALEGVDRFAS